MAHYIKLREFYESFGWSVIHMKNLNHVIASKGPKLHFATPIRRQEGAVLQADLWKEHHEFRNNYVQNALQNNATPVYAYVDTKELKINLFDINLNANVILRRPRDEPAGLAEKQDRQPEKQDRQAEKQAEKHAEKQAEKHTEKHTEKPADKTAEKHTDKTAEKHDRQSDRPEKQPRKSRVQKQ